MQKGNSDKVNKCFISFRGGYCCCVIEYTPLELLKLLYVCVGCKAVYSVEQCWAYMFHFKRGVSKQIGGSEAV